MILLSTMMTSSINSSVVQKLMPHFNSVKKLKAAQSQAFNPIETRGVFDLPGGIFPIPLEVVRLETFEI